MAPLNFSVLDLCPVPSDLTPGEALNNSIALAQEADALGYHRYWLAEHHNMAMLACSVPELLIARIAAATPRIRVGAGGIMLPNHSALHVAETFRVLEAMTPGRIDLGLGRAPGTDGRTALALRRGAAEGEDDFLAQLSDLVGYFNDALPQGHRFERVAAAPTGVDMPPIWILGTSYFGAQVAAINGFGFAFAHHITPEPAVEAMRIYRSQFKPSQFGDAPRAILSLHVLCADSQDEADELARIGDTALIHVISGRTRARFPTRAEALAYNFSLEEDRHRPTRAGRIKAGTPDILRDYILELAQTTQADEIMITSMIGEHQARVKSYRLLADALEIERFAEA